MPALANRPWIPSVSQAIEARVAGEAANTSPAGIASRIEALAADSRALHERDGINLNPATNTMNPRAEAMLAAGLGHRPSLGYAGDKYEMGLEAIEEIEALCAALAAEVFDARFVEFRVASGALANLYAFMATCKPGDRIITPPAEIGGHVTHHGAGAHLRRRQRHRRSGQCRCVEWRQPLYAGRLGALYRLQQLRNRAGQAAR